MPVRAPMETTYTLTANPKIVIRDADGAFIPADEGNLDYVDYLSWLDAGNTPNPAPPEIAHG